MNYNLFNILFLLIFSNLNAQCDSGYTYNDSFPSHINVLDNSTCFYDADLDALMDLISLNDLPFTSPLQDCYVDINGNDSLCVGTQTWMNNRLRFLIAGNAFTGGNILIEILPESFGNLTDLRMLYLNWNNLTTLPISFNQLTNLIYLILSNNNLTEIIDDIGNLENLIFIDLGYNQLESIPESIGQLQNLTHLYIFVNQLTSLPESICNLNIDWDGMGSDFLPYFGSGGNQLCEDVPECILNSENFNTTLDQFYYAFPINVPQECSENQIGDINEDGNIDILDIVSIIDIILGNLQPTENQLLFSDLNQDNSIDIFDIILLVDIILNY